MNWVGGWGTYSVHNQNHNQFTETPFKLAISENMVKWIHVHEEKTSRGLF